MDKKCPYCGAETRPGDNYCLNCGNPLLPATPSSASSQQEQTNDPTLAAPDDWAAAISNPSQANWSDLGGATVANSSELPTQRSDYQAPVAATLEKIEHPARLILHSDNGEIVQDYVLEKFETTIGRAPQSDILLSKDKLTSRRHATIRYEDNQYVLRDERSANGTFVNGQQLEEMVPYVLRDGDHVGIGEHEMIFHTFESSSDNIEHLETIVAPFQDAPAEQTYRTQPDEQSTMATSSNDEYGTQNEVEAEEPVVVTPEVPSTPVQVTPAPLPTSYSSEVEVVPPSVAEYVPDVVTPSVAQSNAPVNTPDDGNVTLSRLNNIAQPALPDMTALMAALSTLDGQIMSLQEQFNATQESMRNHGNEIGQTTSQLRNSLRRVCDRMDNTIADVARSREALAWSELSQLMEDVMNNPRDIEYVTKLARKARELNKIFLIHQNVLNTMAECNSLLRGLIGEENK